MVTVTQFKAKCLSLISEIERGKKPVFITKNGRVAAQLIPACHGETGSRFGCSSKQTVILGDLLGTGEHWDAED